MNTAGLGATLLLNNLKIIRVGAGNMHAKLPMGNLLIEQRFVLWAMGILESCQAKPL